MELSAKQKMFCEEYVRTGNSAASARQAGYSEKTARSIGSRLLTEVGIKMYINDLQKTRTEESSYTTKKLISRLASIIEDNIDKVEFDAPQVMKAMELLGKHLGAWDQPMMQQINIPVSEVRVYMEGMPNIAKNENEIDE